MALGVQKLLAHLLGFHRREDKPVWWAMFDRHAMTPEELVEDIHCLGSMEREPIDAVPIKRSRGFWYRFDPGQDTKISAGDGVIFAHELEIRASVEEMEDEGRRLLHLGRLGVDSRNRQRQLLGPVDQLVPRRRRCAAV